MLRARRERSPVGQAEEELGEVRVVHLVALRALHVLERRARGTAIGAPANHVGRPLLPSAVTVALLAAIESLLSAVVADGMIDDHHDSNQELMGQGLANIASACFGGMAVTGVIARTAHQRVGTRTAVQAVVAGVAGDRVGQGVARAVDRGGSGSRRAGGATPILASARRTRIRWRRRSGMTSRSKLASFSRNHTSWRSMGPRGPAVRTF